jgi:hypothetical protein
VSLFLSSVICITPTQARGEYSRLVPPHLNPGRQPRPHPKLWRRRGTFCDGFRMPANAEGTMVGRRPRRRGFDARCSLFVVATQHPAR